MCGRLFLFSHPACAMQSEKPALLAQLVQSTASTRQGSVVRVHYSALFVHKMNGNRRDFNFILSLLQNQ